MYLMSAQYTKSWGTKYIWEIVTVPKELVTGIMGSIFHINGSKEENIHYIKRTFYLELVLPVGDSLEFNQANRGSLRVACEMSAIVR